MNETKQGTGGLSITEFLMSVREGGAVEDLREKLQQLTQAVQSTGKPGRLTLAIDIKPNGYDAVFVKDDVAVKLPKPDTRESVFFVTKDCQLSRRDPNQPSFEELNRLT